MENKVERNIFFKIAIITFVIFLFVMFFHTSIPFQQTSKDTVPSEGGNIINQVVYTLVFLLSLISLFYKRLDAIEIIKREKLLTIFLLWCLASVLWSYSPIDTAKRFFRIFTGFTVILSLLVHTTSTKEILKIIKPILYIYVFSSIVVCLVVPGAIDPAFQTWRGFSIEKNGLGQVSVICIILSYFIYKMETGYAKLIAAVAVLFSVALLFGSRSMTSISTFLLIIFAGSLLSIDKIFKPLGLGRAASATIFLFIIFATVLVVFVSPEIIDIITEAIGKDPTLSGRTNLWAAILISIMQHPIQGSGYLAFWSVNPPSAYLKHIYDLFIWIPNQSHNGYLDITNEVGFVGLGLCLILIIRYFANLRKLNYPNPWLWVVIASLVINLQESVLFRLDHLVGWMFILSYLFLFAGIWEQDVESMQEI
jgi:exopolysaccharide production protein ExoQ